MSLRIRPRSEGLRGKSPPGDRSEAEPGPGQPTAPLRNNEYDEASSAPSRNRIDTRPKRNHQYAFPEALHYIIFRQPSTDKPPLIRDNVTIMWNFVKMHGAGNDFVVLDGVSQSIEITPLRARVLADRHFGVGADQILLVENPHHPQADFKYRIFNADGSEVEHCGNGARCFVQFVHEQGLSHRNPLRAEIATGLITLDSSSPNGVSVEMGQTRFSPQDVAFDTQGLESTPCGNDTLWQLPLPGHGQTSLSLVAISNPHAVQVVDDVDTAPVAIVGPLIESHPRFAQRVNAGFMQIVDRHAIRLRVYERGAGETLACGTGACAAVIAGIRRGLLDSPVLVETRGGPLTVEWDNTGLRMSGPATTVFKGQVDIDALTQPFLNKDIPT